MWVCYGLRTQIACTNYEMARIGIGVPQPGLKPQTAATSDLDSGCPTRIL